MSKKETQFSMKKISQEKMYYILAGIIFLIALGLLIFFLTREGGDNPQKQNEEVMQTPTSSEESVACKYQRLLDGVCVASESFVNPPVVGVMVENYIEARPQAGLSQASVVYEAPVEGNITRFLVLFAKDSDVEKVGPVRSARPYYLDAVSEYGDAMYMHVGGSPDAIEKIADYKIFDVNEFYRGVYFWRDEKRSAPHNVYTSSDLWNSAYDRYHEESATSTFESWNFGVTTSTCESNCVQEISIPFLRPSYVVNWKYDAEKKQYTRFHGVTVHLDERNNPVLADTIIVQYVKDTILDEVGRRSLGMIGEGRASIYIHGNKFEGTWKKNTRTARTKFFDSAGKEIMIAPGKIWVELVPEGLKVEG